MCCEKPTWIFHTPSLFILHCLTLKASCCCTLCIVLYIIRSSNPSSLCSQSDPLDGKKAEDGHALLSAWRQQRCYSGDVLHFLRGDSLQTDTVKKKKTVLSAQNKQAGKADNLSCRCGCAAECQRHKSCLFPFVVVMKSRFKKNR